MSGTLQIVLDAINKFHQASDLPVLPKTRVISPLYPGQFCYCLDEIHWYEKYHDFIDIEPGNGFQKVQPAIRLRDIENCYNLAANENLHHLGLFTLSTVSGGKVVQKEEGLKSYRDMVKNFLSFFTSLDLDLDRLKATYFSGNTAGNIEMSRKHAHQQPRILIDDYIPEDDFSQILIQQGLKKQQLEGVNTRDNYLTSNWHQCIVPWGYRNEFLYLLPNGAYLDIGTIERLVTKPVIETIDGEGYVVAIQEWDNNLLIDGIGIERLIMAIEEVSCIADISLLTPLKKFIQKLPLPYPESACCPEALRALHRIFTDCIWSELSRQKKDRVRFLMRICKNFPESQITDFLHLHAKIYARLFPDLYIGIDRTFSEISAYRKRVHKDNS